MQTTDVLGRTLDVTRFYPDGSHDCPFCSSPAMYPRERCENPWCPASQAAIEHPESASEFQRKVDEQIARAHEEAIRTERHRQAMTRLEEDQQARNAWLDEQYMEARKRGACVRCLLTGWSTIKFIKHRGACPKVKG